MSGIMTYIASIQARKIKFLFPTCTTPIHLSYRCPFSIGALCDDLLNLVNILPIFANKIYLFWIYEHVEFIESVFCIFLIFESFLAEEDLKILEKELPY